MKPTDSAGAHLGEDELLLLAYDELPDGETGAAEAHLEACASCRATLARLTRSRVALDVAVPRRTTHVVRWVAVAALAAAAVLAGVLLMNRQPTAEPVRGWQPTSVWSGTAGYGGNAMAEIDARLTRLEQERSYGLPN